MITLQLVHYLLFQAVNFCFIHLNKPPENRLKYLFKVQLLFTRDVFYVRREVDLMKTAKVNAYIMHIFGKIELLSIYAT